MTKTLTEQWRNGTLHDGYYYVKLPEEIIIANIYQLKQLDLVNDADEIEVLAAVPTYNEFVQQRDFVKDHLKVLIENMKLKKQHDIAVKTLERIRNVWKNNPKMFEYIAQYANNVAGRALKQIKEKQK